MSNTPFFEPQMLKGIPIILIASKEQQEAEQDYYQNALGLGNEYLFAESSGEARLLVAGNRGVIIDEDFQESLRNMEFARKIPLIRYGTQMTKPYCLLNADCLLFMVKWEYKTDLTATKETDLFSPIN